LAQNIKGGSKIQKDSSTKPLRLSCWMPAWRAYPALSSDKQVL